MRRRRSTSLSRKRNAANSPKTLTFARYGPSTGCEAALYATRREGARRNTFYIDLRSPLGAQKIKARIRDLTTLLIEHPYAGARIDKRGLRRLVAHPFPYVIYYQSTDAEIIIHGVRHGARRPDQSN